MSAKILKRGANAPTKKPTKSTASSSASLSDLQEAANELSGKRKVLFTLAAFKKATKGAYGKHTLIAEDGLPVTFYAKDMSVFAKEGAYFTIAPGFYANSKGAIWPNEQS
jgi:hypothetical protein